MLRKLLAFAVFSTAVAPVALAGPDQWVQVSSNHFVVLTNSNEKQARHIVDQFERMRWVFQTLFPKLNTDPAAPINVYAAKNGKTFQAVEPQAYLAKGQLNLAGYFLTADDRNFVLLRLDAEQENPFATVYHEYTHLQFRSAGDWLPLWLNEGMAEFFQNTEIRDKDVLVGEPSADDILYLRQQQLIPLPVLLKVDASSPYYHQEQKGSVFYAEAWALTHFLLINDRLKKTNMMTDYMNLVSHHEDPVTAAEKAFGDLKQLQTALQAYIGAGQYKQFVLNSAAAPIDESSYTVKPKTQIDADVERADILGLVHREKESQNLIDSVLKADPNNANAHEVLGSAQFRAGHLDDAVKSYGEAVKLDPNSLFANYYFGRLALQGPGSVPDADIESSLRKAIQLNSRFAPAYERLSAFYTMRHERLDEAYSLITSAVKLEPGNLYYRLNAANVVTVMGRYSEASKILQGASKLANNPEEVSMVNSRVQELNQFQEAQAQADEQRKSFEAQQKEQGDATQTVRIVEETEKPKHPADANGPKHTFIGVMHGITCSYPEVLEFQVDGPKGSIKIYNNDFAKIDLTVIGFVPKGPLNPCSDFEGMKARVQYAESTDKTVDGKVFAIELRK